LTTDQLSAPAGDAGMVAVHIAVVARGCPGGVIASLESGDANATGAIDDPRFPAP
jgi:hypothetical protein